MNNLFAQYSNVITTHITDGNVQAIENILNQAEVEQSPVEIYNYIMATIFSTAVLCTLENQESRGNLPYSPLAERVVTWMRTSHSEILQATLQTIPEAHRGTDPVALRIQNLLRD